MIFRQKITHLLFFFRKEFFLLLIIFLSLGSGAFHRHTNDTAWINSQQSVKGDSTQRENDHLREIEIVHAKYTRPVEKKEEKKTYSQAKQIDEYTYTMEVAPDESMASASQIISALNAYRMAKGRGVMAFDQKLSEYAQSRANLFASRGSMDSHAGFQDFINNQNGFHTIGFFSLGENSSLGYQLNGTNLVEKVFAGDAPHDINQLNPEWTHVGVGVNGVAVDIIFGGRKQ